MIIKVKYHNQNCKIKQFGDWIDLKAAETVVLSKPNSRLSDMFDSKLISLGISMQLPKYFEANIVPRSSTYKNYGVIQTNNFGVIDYKYCGNNDIWKFPAIAFKNTTIKEGDRICQFRIRPCQDAPWYIKIKWMFTSKITFKEVKSLNNKDRGGFGSTNKKQ